MRSLVLGIALTALVTLGLVATTPVYANCGPQWPTQCKGAPTPSLPVLDMLVVAVRLALLRS